MELFIIGATIATVAIYLDMRGARIRMEEARRQCITSDLEDYLEYRRRIEERHRKIMEVLNEEI